MDLNQYVHAQRAANLTKVKMQTKLVAKNQTTSPQPAVSSEHNQNQHKQDTSTSIDTACNTTALESGEDSCVVASDDSSFASFDANNDTMTLLAQHEHAGGFASAFRACVFAPDASNSGPDANLEATAATYLPDTLDRMVATVDTYRPDTLVRMLETVDEILSPTPFNGAECIFECGENDLTMGNPCNDSSSSSSNNNNNNSTLDGADNDADATQNESSNNNNSTLDGGDIATLNESSIIFSAEHDVMNTTGAEMAAEEGEEAKPEMEMEMENSVLESADVVDTVPATTTITTTTTADDDEKEEEHATVTGEEEESAATGTIADESTENEKGTTSEDTSLEADEAGGASFTAAEPTECTAEEEVESATLSPEEATTVTTEEVLSEDEDMDKADTAEVDEATAEDDFTSPAMGFDMAELLWVGVLSAVGYFAVMSGYYETEADVEAGADTASETGTVMDRSSDADDKSTTMDEIMPTDSTNPIDSIVPSEVYVEDESTSTAEEIIIPEETDDKEELDDIEDPTDAMEEVAEVKESPTPSEDDLKQLEMCLKENQNPSTISKDTPSSKQSPRIREKVLQLKATRKCSQYNERRPRASALK